VTVVTGVIKSLDVLRTGVNRRLGRAYIPNPKESLYIETSNICNLDCVFCAYGKAEKPKAVMLSSRSAGCGSCSAKSEPTRPDAYGSRRELINLNVRTPSAEFDSGKHKAN